MVVGLAGPMGSGKDTLVPVFQEYNFQVVNLDEWGHKALEAREEEIFSHFGPGIRREDGSVDRRALGAVVFGDPQKLRELNALVHPWIRTTVENLIQSPSEEPWVLNGAILSTLGLEPLCDKLVWVTAPVWIRWLRIKNRDSLSLLAAWKRVTAQKGLTPQQFSRKVDIVIRNGSRGPETSRQQLRRVLELWVNQ